MTWDTSEQFIVGSCPIYLMMMMHLDLLAQLATLLHNILGSWSRAHMALCLTMGDKGGACIIVPTLAIGIHAYSIQLETHEDDFVSPQHLGVPQVICLVIKGPSHSSPFLQPFYSFWHMMEFLRPSNDSPSNCIIISALLRGSFFILWAIWWACHQKDVILHVIFIVGALSSIIRQFESLGGSYKCWMPNPLKFGVECEQSSESKRPLGMWRPRFTRKCINVHYCE